MAETEQTQQSKSNVLKDIFGRVMEEQKRSGERVSAILEETPEELMN